jgi:hypothetical protein
MKKKSYLSHTTWGGRQLPNFCEIRIIRFDRIELWVNYKFNGMWSFESQRGWYFDALTQKIYPEFSFFVGTSPDEAIEYRTLREDLDIPIGVNDIQLEPTNAELMAAIQLLHDKIIGWEEIKNLLKPTVIQPHDDLGFVQPMTVTGLSEEEG